MVTYWIEICDLCINHWAQVCLLLSLSTSVTASQCPSPSLLQRASHQPERFLPVGQLPSDVISCPSLLNAITVRLTVMLFSIASSLFLPMHLNSTFVSVFVVLYKKRNRSCLRNQVHLLGVVLKTV